MSNSFSLRLQLRTLLISIIFLHLFVDQIEGGRILFFVGGITSHSHRSSIHPLAVRLAERGHEVTFHWPLGTKGTEHPKVKEFCADEVRQYAESFQPFIGVVGLQARIGQKYANEPMKDPTALFDMGLENTKVLLNSAAFLEWVELSKFDLVIMDSALNEVAFALAHYWKAKTIIYSSTGSIATWDVGIHGLPAEVSWIPSYDVIYDGTEMGFFERLYTTYVTYLWSTQYTQYYLPRLDQLVREKLGERRVGDMPSLEKVMGNMSLFFINGHQSDTFPRPYPPFVVQVGGMHVDEKPNGTLPLEIESFIRQDGDPGFIYISFGSIVRISTLPDWLLKSFFGAIEKTRLRFLWKWEGEVPPNPPKNIFFSKWFPQQNVLAHPKIRGFIMQGGHISVQQAICHGVPLIIFPTVGDQDYSAKRMRIAGNGLELEFNGLTSDDLAKAIDHLINVPSYAAAAKNLAQACRDRPMTPLEHGAWWVEYALRTDDTSHLKPQSRKQPLWIQWSVDIWAFIVLLLLSAILTVVTGTFFVVRYALKAFKTRDDAKTMQKNKIKMEAKKQS